MCLNVTGYVQSNKLTANFDTVNGGCLQKEYMAEMQGLSFRSLAMTPFLRVTGQRMDQLEKSMIGDASNEDKFCQEDISSRLERAICHSEQTRILSSNLMCNSRILQSGLETEDKTRTVLNIFNGQD